MLRHCFVLLLALAFAVPAPAQSVALTFDDGLDPQARPEAATWNALILDALAKGKVTAMILPACKNAQTPEGLKLVKDWGQAGHFISNHTFSHRNLASSDMTAEAFIADVEKCHAMLSALPGWSARLRFPYLKEGDTAQKRDALRQWIAAHQYKPAPVSNDASDWYYSDRYLKWRKARPEGKQDVYRDAYLAHLWDRARYYDNLSKQVLNRSAKHVLLLHTNAINAQFLPDVIAMFRSKGWKIISPEEAFADPLYSMLPDTLPAGESILWALAKDGGGKGLRYPAEDGKYEAELLDALEAREARAGGRP
jgi:peptidoglycan/xylan/chitin deacetylase (PgdA/CDA1 family)